MKVFATLATVLGVTSAAPTQMGFGRQDGFRSMNNNNNHRQMSNMEMSGRQMADRQMSQMGMSSRQYSGEDRQMSMNMGMDRFMDNMGMDRRMDNMGMDRRMDNMGMDRHRDNLRHEMANMGMDRQQMYGHQMSGQQMSGMRMSAMDNNRQMSMYNDNVDQYYKRDDFGNYAYGYTNGNSEKYEVGNPQGGVKGHYMYVDSNGLNRRVEYIADDQGFRIVGKDGERFKREADAEPTMRMTSVMDSRSMMDDDMYQMERNMRRNGMSMNRRNMFDRQMFDRQMSRNNNVMDMYRNNNMMMDRDMMNMNRMGDRHMSMNRMSGRQMSDRQMSDRQMSMNMMNNNNRFFDMYDMTMPQMSVEMPQMRMDDGILGERNTMSQRMEIERIPENNVSFMLF